MNHNFIDKQTDTEITAWLDTHFSELLTDWIELCRIPSIKSAPEEGAPYGKECKRALEFATGLFEKYGFETELDTKGGYALAYFGKGEHTIGLFSHSDVVPVGEGWIYTEPFEPRVINDGKTLVGRGVEDNKSGIIETLSIMRMMKEGIIPFEGKIVAFIGSNEETGMEDIKAFAKDRKHPDLSFIPDGGYPLSVGEKGICNLYALSDKSFSDIISVSGGEAFNIVLDKVRIKLSLTDAIATELTAKSSENDSIDVEILSDSVLVTAHGIAKHASEPEGSINACAVAFGFLSECNSICVSDRNIMKNALPLIEAGFGEGAGISHTDPSFGKLTMVNGMADTEDKRLKLSFDIRYGASLDGSCMAEKLAQNLSPLGFSLTDIDNKEGFILDDIGELAEKLESIYCELTGKNKKRFFMGGGTYARCIKNAISIGTFDYNSDIIPFEMPAGHGGAHQCDEKIDLQAFKLGIRINAQYIIAADRELSERI